MFLTGDSIVQSPSVLKTAVSLVSAVVVAFITFAMESKASLESGEVISCSHGETLGDRQVAYGEGALRDKTDQTFAAQNVRIPAGNYDDLRKKAIRSACVW